jgi:hypothetical protein
MKLETAQEILKCYKEDGKAVAYDWYGKDAVEAVLTGNYEWYEF